MTRKNLKTRASARWCCVPAALLALVVVMGSGCGVETGKANQALEAAEHFQAEAEEILLQIREFPAQWEAAFSAGEGPAQVAQGQELVDTRVSDLDRLDAVIDAWEQELTPILEMSVDYRVKEYVKLKLGALNYLNEYVNNYLRPLFSSYQMLAGQIGQGKDRDALDRTAAEIARMAIDASSKLEDCRSALKQAEDYFVENELGK